MLERLCYKLNGSTINSWKIKVTHIQLRFIIKPFWNRDISLVCQLDCKSNFEFFPNLLSSTSIFTQFHFWKIISWSKVMGKEVFMLPHLKLLLSLLCFFLFLFFYLVKDYSKKIFNKNDCIPATSFCFWKKTFYLLNIMFYYLTRIF